MSNSSRRPLTTLEVPSPVAMRAPRRLALVLLAVVALVVSLATPSVAFAATSEMLDRSLNQGSALAIGAPEGVAATTTANPTRVTRRFDVRMSLLPS